MIQITPMITKTINAIKDSPMYSLILIIPTIIIIAIAIMLFLTRFKRSDLSYRTSNGFWYICIGLCALVIVNSIWLIPRLHDGVFPTDSNETASYCTNDDNSDSYENINIQ